VSIENEKVSGGSAYNLLAVEVGAPGLLLWIGLSLSVIVLGVRRLRRIVDPELRIYMVAVLASYVGFTVQGLAGTTLAVTPAGAYIWFVPGVIAYWFAGAGRSAMTRTASAAMTTASGATV
jgi:O-antigen ligase